MARWKTSSATAWWPAGYGAPLESVKNLWKSEGNRTKSKETEGIAGYRVRRSARLRRRGRAVPPNWSRVAPVGVGTPFRRSVAADEEEEADAGRRAAGIGEKRRKSNETDRNRKKLKVSGPVGVVERPAFATGPVRRPRGGRRGVVSLKSVKNDGNRTKSKKKGPRPSGAVKRATLAAGTDPAPRGQSRAVRSATGTPFRRAVAADEGKGVEARWKDWFGYRVATGGALLG